MGMQFLIVTISGQEDDISALLPILTGLIQHQRVPSYTIKVGVQLSPDDPIEALDLQTHGLVLNLHRAGIDTIAELCKYSEEGLHQIYEGPNGCNGPIVHIGPVGTREIVEKLAQQGMRLGSKTLWG